MYIVSVIVIGGILYFLFRRPGRDAQYDNHSKALDQIAKDRDKNIPEHTKWHGF
jgi:preprotein translocase subunit YajC